MEVQEAWLRGVLPAVMDSESSVQEKALECLDQVILTKIKSQGKYHHGDTSQRLAWDLLGLICEKCEDLRSVAHHLTNRHCCTRPWFSPKRLSSGIVRHLKYNLGSFCFKIVSYILFLFHCAQKIVTRNLSILILVSTLHKQHHLGVNVINVVRALTFSLHPFSFFAAGISAKLSVCGLHSRNSLPPLWTVCSRTQRERGPLPPGCC